MEKKYYTKFESKWEKYDKASKADRHFRCRACGQMYECEGMPSGVCSPCKMSREEQYQVVRAVVREYPGITALDVHEVTEVPMDVILRYIDNGLLEVVATRDEKGEISERVGIMIKRAKERAKVILKQSGKDGKIEELKITMENSKFTWLEE